MQVPAELNAETGRNGGDAVPEHAWYLRHTDAASEVRSVGSPDARETVHQVKCCSWEGSLDYSELLAYVGSLFSWLRLFRLEGVVLRGISKPFGVKGYVQRAPRLVTESQLTRDSKCFMQ